MEKGIQNINSFHLAGIVPVAGQKLDFNFPWHDCLQPINKDYLAVERAVYECACAGCETIWIVCHDDMQPLIRYRLGDYVQDPQWVDKNRLLMPEGVERPIPIYYVPIHPKDRDKRDCLGWSVLHGAQTAYWLSKTISQWVIPDRYYAAFPYGAYDPELLRPFRKQISSKKPFFVSHQDRTIKSNEYLGFTFDADDFKACRSLVRREGTGIHTGYKEDKLSIEERWSARFFSLDKIFEPVNIEGANVLKLPWYYNISSWQSLCEFLGSKDSKKLDKPPAKVLGYHEWNPIGVDNEKE
jgi:hypothetical protein